jgi:flagellin-like protein
MIKLLGNFYKKKAVTPVIATVLLIAITVVLFLIIFLFGRGFFKEALMKQEMPVAQACEEVSLEIIYYNEEGNLEISNSGNIAIYGFSVRAREGRRTQTENYYGRESDENIIPIGRLKTFELNLDNPTSIEVFPIILAEDEKGELVEYTCGKDSFDAEIK